MLSFVQTCSTGLLSLSTVFWSIATLISWRFLRCNSVAGGAPRLGSQTPEPSLPTTSTTSFFIRASVALGLYGFSQLLLLTFIQPPSFLFSPSSIWSFLYTRDTITGCPLVADATLSALSMNTTGAKAVMSAMCCNVKADIQSGAPC